MEIPPIVVVIVSVSPKPFAVVDDGLGTVFGVMVKSWLPLGNVPLVGDTLNGEFAPLARAIAYVIDAPLLVSVTFEPAAVAPQLVVPKSTLVGLTTTVLLPLPASDTGPGSGPQVATVPAS